VTTLPVDVLDEIDRLLSAASSTPSPATRVVYVAEARIRVEAAGERLARCRAAVEAIEAEIARVARVAAEGGP
jgi:primosomal protein N''